MKYRSEQVGSIITYVVLWLLINAFFFISMIIHVFYCLSYELYGMLILGLVCLPIGIIHGIYIGVQ